MRMREGSQLVPRHPIELWSVIPQLRCLASLSMTSEKQEVADGRMNATLYRNSPQTATIAASPLSRVNPWRRHEGFPAGEEHGRQRHRHKNRHRGARLSHRRGEPPGGLEAVRAALLARRISDARADEGRRGPPRL